MSGATAVIVTNPDGQVAVLNEGFKYEATGTGTPNVAEAPPAGGMVWVSGKRMDADMVEISVTDEGPGIPASAQDRIFERYVQLNPESTLKQGMGLGLWFQLGIVAAGLQVAWHYTLIRGRSRDGCFKAFRLNHWVGAAVFAGTVLAGWAR